MMGSYRNLTLIQEKIQEAVKLVEKWLYSWGFRFSVEKTKVVVFPKKKMREAGVKMYGKQSEQVYTLGVLFDTKLTWSDHINKIVALIRSVIDYGSVVYRSAAKTLLKKLEVIQNQALRLCCRAIKTSLAIAIQVEMGEIPLNQRYKQLMMNYWASL